MVMGEVPNKDVPDEGGIIVEGVMGLELKRSRVQHTVFTVSIRFEGCMRAAGAWPQQAQEETLWWPWLRTQRRHCAAYRRRSRAMSWYRAFLCYA